SVLGFYRDMTARKEREEALAAAKEAAEAARNDVERAYQTTQSILDNLSDGVVLADKNFDLKFANRHFAEFLQMPAELARPGRSAYDVLRFLARRGDFGPVESEKDVERIVQERAAIIRARWRFSNKHHRDLHGYTSEVAHPGVSGYDLIRHLINRGEYGDV